MKISDVFNPDKVIRKKLEDTAFFLGSINKCCNPQGIAAVGYHTNIESEIGVLESYEKAGIVKITPDKGGPSPRIIKVLLTDEGKELLQDFEEKGYLTKDDKEKINNIYSFEIIE